MSCPISTFPHVQSRIAKPIHGRRLSPAVISITTIDDDVVDIATIQLDRSMQTLPACRKVDLNMYPSTVLLDTLEGP